MLSVYKVSRSDIDSTRLVLPATQWAFEIREELSRMGFEVTSLPDDPDLLRRDEAELARRDQLLDLTDLPRSVQESFWT